MHRLLLSAALIENIACYLDFAATCHWKERLNAFNCWAYIIVNPSVKPDLLQNDTQG